MWAIRHPKSGAVYGWHADPDRIGVLYWESLGADDRCELVTVAVAALEKRSHRRAWTSTWHHWNRDAGTRRRAVEEVVTAWVRGNRRDLNYALAALSEEPFPDDPAWLEDEDRELPEDARLPLEHATAALVAGQVNLARYIYVYAQVAASDPGQLPALLSTLTAVAEHLDDPPPPPPGRAPRPAGRLRGVGPRQYGREGGAGGAAWPSRGGQGQSFSRQPPVASQPTAERQAVSAMSHLLAAQPDENERLSGRCVSPNAYMRPAATASPRSPSTS